MTQPLIGRSGKDPRYPYRDSVLTLLAGTEEVITNRNGEADRFRADRAAECIPRYADGGMVATAPVVHTTVTAPAATAGRSVIFNGPVTSTDVHALARESHQRDRDAAALLGVPA